MSRMARVLLINPSYAGSYGAARAGVVNPVFPTLGLTTIAGAALARGHRVQVLDLSDRPYDWRQLRSVILKYMPEVVGITATTPLMNQLRDISVLCKDISTDITVVGGGAHVSAMPTETLLESLADLAIVGEGEETFADVCDGRHPRDVPGLYFRDGQHIRFSGARPLIANLDDLPMPAWHLYDPAYYRTRISRLLARRPPVTMAEFSRGCVYACDFCGSKLTTGHGYRRKSPERCAEEVRVMHRLGWREFMLADDIFTTDRAWARRVSEAIAATGVRMAWSCTNGIRVESADAELFRAMHRAGCYRVAYGLETGSDEVLQALGKGGRASVEQGRIAVNLARSVGLEVGGYFLLGLSGDDEASMHATIEYARSLDLDLPKFGVTVAFPGTPMFDASRRAGRVQSYDWDAYHIYSSRPLSAHPHLSPDVIAAAMSRAYRRAIVGNPRYLVRRLFRAAARRTLHREVGDAVRFLLRRSTNARPPATVYYARDRWPMHECAVHGDDSAPIAEAG